MCFPIGCLRDFFAIYFFTVFEYSDCNFSWSLSIFIILINPCLFNIKLHIFFYSMWIRYCKSSALTSCLCHRISIWYFNLFNFIRDCYSSVFSWKFFWCISPTIFSRKCYCINNCFAIFYIYFYVCWSDFICVILIIPDFFNIYCSHSWSMWVCYCIFSIWVSNSIWFRISCRNWIFSYRISYILSIIFLW